MSRWREVGLFAAAHSEHPDTLEASTEILGDLSERLTGNSDLAIIFASGSHVGGLRDLSRGLTELLGVDTVLGVSVSGVVGGGREVQSGSGLSVWVGETGPVRSVRMEAIDSGRTVLGIPEAVEPGSVLLLLADPFSFPVDRLLESVDGVDLQIVGGLASFGRSPEENSLLMATRSAADPTVHRDGAVGVILPPGVATPVVSQGCRPIGQPWVITDGSGQMIRQLGGQSAMDRLQPIIDQLSPEDRALAAKGLHVGIVANEQTERFERGDFLIRSLLGADRNSGSIAVGDRIEAGQVIQFHVRDAQSASEDLYEQLAMVDRSAHGSLLFTCTGRGTNMFDEEHHDAFAIIETFAEVANAGMFCAGEIGPVGSRNALHGFTATMLLF